MMTHFWHTFGNSICELSPPGILRSPLPVTILILSSLPQVFSTLTHFQSKQGYLSKTQIWNTGYIIIQIKNSHTYLVPTEKKLKASVWSTKPVQPIGKDTHPTIPPQTAKLPAFQNKFQDPGHVMNCQNVHHFGPCSSLPWILLTFSIPSKYQWIIQGQDMLSSLQKLQKLSSKTSVFFLHHFLCNRMDYVLSHRWRVSLPKLANKCCPSHNTHLVPNKCLFSEWEYKTISFAKQTK